MNITLIQFAFKELNQLCEYLCDIDPDNEFVYASLFTSVMQEMLESPIFCIHILEVVLYMKKVSIN